ncbi:MAG: hypothetical protein ACLFRB_10415 [Thiohalorhabdus sp.]|uniref:hypothetical protein n=1 Tax=Thiohalorhabdus sp. TaxID=3094134 RepID=UPI00397F79D5
MSKIGVLVATDEFPDCASGLLRQAAAHGAEAACFLTDAGVKVLQDPDFRAAAEEAGAGVTVCEHSWERFGLGEPLPGYQYASQYQNALMMGWAEKVLVL